jgi:hypothetical protein
MSGVIRRRRLCRSSVDDDNQGGRVTAGSGGWLDSLLDAMHYPSHSGVYTIIPALAGAYLTYSGFARRRQ